jgi:hypothetical protein
MEGFILSAHRYLRFVILGFGILGVLRALASLNTREAKFMRVDNVLARLYNGALDVQVLVGVGMVLLYASQAKPLQWLHPLIMLPAVVVSHLGRRFRTRPDRDRHKAQLAIYVGSLALVAVGLAVIGELRLM